MSTEFHWVELSSFLKNFLFICDEFITQLKVIALKSEFLSRFLFYKSLNLKLFWSFSRNLKASPNIKDYLPIFTILKKSKTNFK